MAENSLIGWTDHTWNPWWGCHKVSDECFRCYIAGIMRRAGKQPFNGPILTKTWNNPPKWEREAQRTGKRFRIFTCSMSDFFHVGADNWREAAWDGIRACPHLDWLILTKRAERIRTCLPADWGEGYSNVLLGVTCGIESSLDRVRILADIPSAIRFISAEPLLGEIDFTPYLDGRIQWIITGCENAAKEKRRPMDMAWVRGIDRQCRAARIPHFFKQCYEGSKLVFDGLLDGEVRQEWPRVGRSRR